MNIGKKNLEYAIGNGKTWIYKIILITLTASILLYTSVFMYASFYFAFIPVVAHEVLVFNSKRKIPYIKIIIYLSKQQISIQYVIHYVS